MGRTHEKLTHVEGQIASLEEKKTGAEQALHRVQNEMREAQDLVNATKKHSAVLQDTLTVRCLRLSPHKLPHALTISVT